MRNLETISKSSGCGYLHSQVLSPGKVIRIRHHIPLDASDYAFSTLVILSAEKQELVSSLDGHELVEVIFYLCRVTPLRLHCEDNLMLLPHHPNNVQEPFTLVLRPVAANH